MAEVTSPLTLDTTSQDIVSKLNTLNGKLDTVNTNLASIASGGGGGGDNVPVTVSSTDLNENVSALPSGQLYIYVPLS